jgi:hypothetical protein
LIGKLPGGQDVLAHYRMQNIQREQELQRQRLQERAMQNHLQQQQRKASANSNGNRKKSRHLNNEEQDFSTDYLATPSIPPFQQQQQSSTVTNRIFMAVFMAISFFSSSPLSAGPTSKEQFKNHNHISRTADDLASNSSSTFFLSSLFPVSDTW